MVVIRLARGGSKSVHFIKLLLLISAHLVMVVLSRKSAFNPMARGQEVETRIDLGSL